MPSLSSLLGLVGLAAIAPAFAATTCKYLDETNICGPAFTGYPAKVDTATFNAGIQSLATLSKAGCNGNTDSLRYQTSAWCAAYITSQLLETDCVAQVPTTNIDPTNLCAAQCNIASVTHNAYLADTTVCPAVPAVGPAQTARNTTPFETYNVNPNYASYCDYVATRNPATCWGGVSAENGAVCGYFNQTVANVQCRSNANDPCCKELLLSISTGKPFSTVVPAGTASSSNHTTIVVVAIVLIALVAVGIGGCLCVRGRNNRRQQKRSRNVEVGSGNMYSSKSDPYSQQNDHRNAPPVPRIPVTVVKSALKTSPSVYNNNNNNNGYGQQQQQQQQNFHQQAPLSPSFRDSWSSPLSPPEAYHPEIPMAPMSSVTRQPEYQSHQQYPGSQPQQQESSPFEASMMTSLPRNLTGSDTTESTYAPNASAGQHTDSSSPWNAPVVTAKSLSPTFPMSPLEAAIATSAQMEANDAGELLNIPMRVLHQYDPTLLDELPLQAGSEIVMIRCFDDGWALGVNPGTGQTGAFPLVCVANLDSATPADKQQEQAASQEIEISKRASSQQFLSKMDQDRLRMMGRETVRRSMGGDLRGTSSPRPFSPLQNTSAAAAPRSPMPHDSFGKPSPLSKNVETAPSDPFVVEGEPETPSLPVAAPPRRAIPTNEAERLSPTHRDSGPFDDEHRIADITTDVGASSHVLPEVSSSDGSLGINMPSSTDAPAATNKTESLDDYYTSAAESLAGDDENPFKSH